MAIHEMTAVLINPPEILHNQALLFFPISWAVEGLTGQRPTPSENDMLSAQIMNALELMQAGIDPLSEGFSAHEGDYCVYFANADGDETDKPITIYLAKVESSETDTVVLRGSPLATVNPGSIVVDIGQSYWDKIKINVPRQKRAFLFPEKVTAQKQR